MPIEHFKYTTEDVGRHEAIQFWADHVLPLLEASMVQVEAREFRCVLQGRRREELAIGRYCASGYAGAWRENARLIGHHDSARILRVRRGEVHLNDNRGREWRVAAGETFFAGPDSLVGYRILPGSGDGSYASVIDIVMLPLRILSRFGVLIERDMSIKLNINVYLRLFAQYMAELISPKIKDVDFNRLFNNFLDLVAIMLKPEISDVGLRSILDTRYADAVRLIKNNYSDPNLNISSACAILGIGERSLFKAFESRDEKFHHILTEERLSHAARKLRDIHDTSKIICIALDSGFDSISTFNRNFKARFGVSPVEYRIYTHSLGLDGVAK